MGVKDTARQLTDGAKRFMTARFARYGSSSPFGKVGQSLGSLRLHEETEMLVRAAASRAGKPIVEFVRDYLEQGFHGRKEIERRQTLHLDFIQQVLPKRNGKERG